MLDSIWIVRKQFYVLPPRTQNFVKENNSFFVYVDERKYIGKLALMHMPYKLV